MFEQPSPPTFLSAFSDLSGPADAVQRATEAGCGVLSVGRPWVQFEGFVLKEGGLGGGWHLRYFVVSGDRLEYFKEEKVKHDSPSLSAMGVVVDQTNVVVTVPQPRATGLQLGDVVIGVNGEAVLGRGRVDEALKSAPHGAVAFTVLRPKGQLALLGASVQAAGPRKQGGHMLTVSGSTASGSESSSRRWRYNLVCAEERLCAGWIASVKEAIAASAMEEIKTALSQALSLQALELSSAAAPPAAAGAAVATGVPAPPPPPMQRSASVGDVSLVEISTNSAEVPLAA